METMQTFLSAYVQKVSHCVAGIGIRTLNEVLEYFVPLQDSDWFLEFQLAAGPASDCLATVACCVWFVFACWVECWLFGWCSCSFVVASVLEPLNGPVSISSGRIC